VPTSTVTIVVWLPLVTGISKDSSAV